MEYITTSPEQTQTIAYDLAMNLNKGTVLLLTGDLGAGKTTFSKGFARGLGITAKVNSPTFVIQKEYEGRLNMVHIDAYRLEGIQQDLGFEDFIDPQNVVLIEWPQFLQMPYLSHYLDIKFEYIDDATRKITIQEVNK